MFICNFITYLIVLIYVNYYLKDKDIKLVKENNTFLGKLLLGTVAYFILSYVTVLMRFLLSKVGVSLPQGIVLFIAFMSVIILRFINPIYDKELFKLQILDSNIIIIKFFSVQLELKLRFLNNE